MKKPLVLLAIVAAMVATGCGGGTKPIDLPPITTQQIVELVARDNYFGPEMFEAKAGSVAFVLKNGGFVAHNLIIKHPTGRILGETPNVTRNRSSHVQLDLEPGAYQLICSVPGHATMTASLIVR